MSCTYEEELTALVDGELPELRAAEVARHLEGCATCAVTARLLRRAVGCLEALPAPPPAAALRHQVLAAVEASSWRERLSGWLRPRVWIPALGLAAAALVAVLAVRPDTAPAPDTDLRQLELAMALEVAEDYEVAGLESVEDLELVAELHALEVR